ncbi:hypothetical protein H1P_4020007 [Hyella patelloides LEGE 07179]|uniref:Uncharacterized protein n=1 Tax=Hyella patelloides LEGE 07179 TaxID=945734 RepID=A0A563VXE8_9CYAN|nr:hypothetical protein [Hyella patelloides]VEP16096.1 hypothetical protein H1P_4020007 [Hyella patelloides LEGE 07179]
MTTYLISIQIKPLTYKPSTSETLPEIMAFQEEEDRYYLAGAEQITDKLTVLLPEIHQNNPQIIRFKLEITEGDEIDANFYQDFLNLIKN